jgi:hypothetical protein
MISEGLLGKTIIVNVPKLFNIAVLKFQKSNNLEIKYEIINI